MRVQASHRGHMLMPHHLPNLAAWYRAGVGITVTGSGVSTWADRSGNGRDLLQATDAARPALQSDGSILFNGASHFLKAATFALAQPITVYGLFKHITWTSNDYIWDGELATRMSLFQTVSTPRLNIRATTSVAANANLALDKYGAVAAIYSGAASLLQVNLTAPTTGDAGASAGDGFTLGAIGGGGSGWAHMQAKEFAIFAAAHDAITRARLIQYMLTMQ